MKKLELAFKYFDQNSDGIIDGKELKDALESSQMDYTTNDFKEMLQECGTVSYGKMNYKEFLRGMSVLSNKNPLIS